MWLSVIQSLFVLITTILQWVIDISKLLIYCSLGCILFALLVCAFIPFSFTLPWTLKPILKAILYARDTSKGALINSFILQWSSLFSQRFSSLEHSEKKQSTN